MSWKGITLSLITFVTAVYLTLVTAYAQVAASSSSQQVSEATVDYQLPYPGLLPDNPFYFLKAFRDQLTEFFLSKPLDRAQFDLLQSDKNTEASYLLVTQEANKTDLALTTFSQGEDDFSKAIDQVSTAKKQGYSILDMSKKLDLSNQKHLQILLAINQQIGKMDIQTLQSERTRIDTFSKEIHALR